MDSGPPHPLRRRLWRPGLSALLPGCAPRPAATALERRFQAGARVARAALSARPEACRGFRAAGPSAPEIGLILLGLVAGAMAIGPLPAGKR